MKMQKRMVVLGSCLLLAVQAKAVTVFNLNAADLTDQNGALLSQNAIALIVLDANSNGFDAVTPTSSLTVGGALSGGDDLVIAKFDLSAPGINGALINTFTVTYGGSVSSGDPFKLYWFPSLTTSSTQVGSGTYYGSYTDAVGNNSAAWVLPNDTGAQLDLNMGTPNNGIGVVVNITAEMGKATLQTIPEPSSALLVGLSACGAFALIDPCIIQ